ncbi:MAG: M48 family metallopeptidase [Candidatus Acidiferrales bacterium]
MKRIRVVILGSLISVVLAWPVLAAQQSAPQQPAAPDSTQAQSQSQTPQQSQQNQPAQTPSQPTASGGATAPSGSAPQSSGGAAANPSAQPQASPSQAPPPPPPGADTNGQTPSQGQPAQPQAQPQPAAQQEQPKVKPGSEQDVNSIGNRNVGHGLDMYSLETEIAMGKEAAQEVERSSKLVDDPIVVEFVNRVGQNLVRNSDAKVPFTIKVIDSDVINAFALPGGFFYVNSGLILAADTEAELAGVMGHEIAHVCARHAMRNATKIQIMQLATIPLILLGPGGWAGYGIYEAAQLAIPISYLKFSRDAEREADYLGLQYMYKAGYDPNAFITFFEKIEAEEKRNPGTIPKLFEDHPPTPDRMEAAQREIATILPPRDQYIVTTSEFDMVKARLRRIENRQKVQDTQPGKPTLRKRTETQQPPDGQAQPGDGTSTSSSPASTDDPDRPVLKKRTDAPDNSGTSGGTNNGGTNNGGTTNGGSGSGGTSNGSGGGTTGGTSGGSGGSTSGGSTSGGGTNGNGGTSNGGPNN